MKRRLAAMTIAYVTMAAPACAAEKFVGLRTEPILFYSPSLSLEHEDAQGNPASYALSSAQPTTTPNPTAGRPEKGAGGLMPSQSSAPMASGSETALLVFASFAAVGFVAHRRRPR